jgi:hypothetical protein
MQIKQLPSNTQAKLNLSGSQTVTRNEFAIIGDAAATSFVINHGQYQSCTCFIHRNAAPYDEVETEVKN